LRIRIRSAKIRVRLPLQETASFNGFSPLHLWQKLSLLLSSCFAVAALAVFNLVLWHVAFAQSRVNKTDQALWLAAATVFFLLSCLCAWPPRRSSANAYFYSRYRIENHLPNPYPK
jgi:hypothetical protein